MATTKLNRNSNKKEIEVLKEKYKKLEPIISSTNHKKKIVVNPNSIYLHTKEDIDEVKVLKKKYRKLEPILDEKH